MLTLFTIILQDVGDGVIDAVSKISPYDATAYGGLVLVLVIFLYMQYKDKQKQAESLEKVVETMKDIELSLRDIPELKMLILTHLLNNKQSPNSDV